MTTDTLTQPGTRRRPVATVATAILRWLGWLLIAAGVLVGLFIVYLLYWTGRDTTVAQQQMRQAWEVDLGIDLDAAQGGVAEIPVMDSPVQEVTDAAAAPSPGSAYALLWFERDGQRILVDEVLSVIQGVSRANLADGPGHYPDTDGPGERGNFVIAGHRTTWAAPFHDLDQLVDGDEIHVVDHDGNHFVYDFRELEIVQPDDRWVLDEDPLGTGDDHWLTLTTCHPRYSARQRLIAFATLRTGQ